MNKGEKMGLFQEYMDSKGNIRKAKVDVSGGDPDPKTPPSKPPKENGDKPYASSDGKGPKNKSEKGLGDKGDESLKYMPVKGSNTGHAAAKIPTCEQFELATLVSEAAERDPSLIEQVVRQIKQRGLLGAFVAEMLEHGATYSHLSEMMSSDNYGPNVCRRLVRAMKEEVAPAFSDQMNFEDDEEEDEENPAIDGSEEDDLFADDDEMEPDEMGQSPQGAPMPPMPQDPMAQGAPPMPPMPQDPSMAQGAPPMPPPSKAMMNFQRAMMRSI